ncbi:MAG TPA: class I SAM-dependent methyltransferase [Saprospiraceae bacterium]|nr:class I SAM-dependent methyltransferase [Saprospiraceae bacterium]
MLNKEFNQWQRDYNTKIRRWVPNYDGLISAMTEWSGQQPPTSILDLGCGNGNVVSALLPRYPRAQFTLVDASEDMLRACRQLFGHQKNIRYANQYFQELSFQPASFDLVVAGLAFHHLKGAEKQLVFQKIFQWLRPGGRLLASDLYASKQWPDYQQKVMAPWAAFAKKAGTPAEEWEAMLIHHAQFDFPDAFEDQEAWLQEAGFSAVEITYLVGYWGTIQARK